MSKKTTTEIKILKKDFAQLDSLSDSIRNAEGAFQYASFMLRESKEALWEFIYKQYPEAEKYKCVYDYAAHKLTISGKKADKRISEQEEPHE